MRFPSLPVVALLALAPAVPCSADVDSWSPGTSLTSGVRWYVNVSTGTLAPNTTLLGSWTWALTWVNVPGYQPTLTVDFNPSQGLSGASVAVSASMLMTKLAAGSSVGPTTVFSPAGTSHVAAAIGNGAGAFSAGSVGYFGFRFLQAGETRYGWTKLRWDSGGQMTLLQIAHETTPDTAIQVGALGVPAPGVLAAAALSGALGKRRRRDLH